MPVGLLRLIDRLLDQLVQQLLHGQRVLLDGEELAPHRLRVAAALSEPQQRPQQRRQAAPVQAGELGGGRVAAQAGRHAPRDVNVLPPVEVLLNRAITTMKKQ